MLATRSPRSWPLGLVIAIGCSAFSGRSHRDHGRPPDAGRSDAGRSDAGSPGSVPTTITVENDGSAPIVLGNLCGGRFLGLTHDGEELAYDRSCACECGSDACGCGAICLFTQELLVPGEHTSFVWDGLFASVEGHPECYELGSLPKGDEVVATACWNEDPSSGKPLDCASEDFAYDDERDVTISAEHDSAARTPVQIVFQNLTGAPIEIVTDSSCHQDWFQLALPLEAGRSASISSSCPCACDESFELSMCPECDTCPLATREMVAQGGTRSFEWDGMFWYGYASGCSAQYAMPAGFQVNAQICFTRQSKVELTCQPVTFTLGESAQVFTSLL